MSDELLVVEGLEDFLSDPEKETEGVWREMADGSNRQFLIAHGSNPRYQAKLNRLMRPRMAILKRRDDKAIVLMNKLQGMAMSGTVLLNWKGVPKKFTEKLGEQVLVDAHYRKLREQIEEWAETEEAEFEVDLKEASKNS